MESLVRRVRLLLAAGGAAAALFAAWGIAPHVAPPVAPLLAPSTAWGQETAGYTAAGVFVRGDGMRGYFILGTFADAQSCHDAVTGVAERIVGEARWIGQRFDYRLEPCRRSFPDGTIHRNLEVLRDIGHYVLLHANLRLAIASADGVPAEEEACRQLARYFQHLFGGQSLCAAPHPQGRRML